MFSRACEYAIQALLDLVDQPPGVYVPVREVARRCDIPFHFLGKIVQYLTKRGLLISNKGPNGGIALASPANEITLLQVVEAIDGLDLATRCVIGLPACQDAAPCPLHIDWRKTRTQILGMLTRKTLMQLAMEGKSLSAVVSV
jgi:Rrf2 family protein